ncbi:hypothetical protein BH09PAT4_BH09PAT4_02060 [soil metagenome]
MVKKQAMQLPTENRQRGAILASIMILSAALLLIGLSIASAAAGQYKITNDAVYIQNALLAAEAGVEQSVNQLNQNDGFAGYTSPQTFFDSTDQGRGTFVTSIVNSPDDTNAKILTSTGYTYRHGASGKLVSKQGIKVTVVGTSSPGYSVYAGPGGLIMNGAASLNNSDVYVNGGIKLSGNSHIGSDINPATVYAANYSCPTGATPGSTYPSVCTSTQPISIDDWSPSSIIGTVCATGQTQAKFPLSPYNNNPPQIRAGTSGGEGLKTGCVAPYSPPPTYDRQAQINAVTTTASGTSNTYVCNSWPFDRTWTGNLKLTGNVRLTSSCIAKLKGNVYITGDLLIDGAAKLIVDDSVGTTRPNIIVDGRIDVSGAAALLPNSSGTGIQFISFKTNASCNPNCTTLTGNALKSSQTLETVAISGGVNLPGMIFNSYWGRITITGSGNVGSAIGQTVDLSGAGTVIFGTSLSSGVHTWAITSYQRLYNK